MCGVLERVCCSRHLAVVPGQEESVNLTGSHCVVSVQSHVSFSEQMRTIISAGSRIELCPSLTSSFYSFVENVNAVVPYFP